MILWLVGLSGSGKTTIGREIYALWRPIAPNTVLVDGDQIRRIMGRDTSPLDYTLEGRRENALRVVEICSWLDSQQINVVCCILCIFDDIMLQNRRVFSSYFQVFLDAPLELVTARDPKGIYKKAIRGDEKNVVGVDIPFLKPSDTDLLLGTADFPAGPKALAEIIIKKAGVIS